MQSSTICFIFTFWSLIYKRDILRGWGGREEVFKVLEGTHRNSPLKLVKNAISFTLRDIKLGNLCV